MTKTPSIKKTVNDIRALQTKKVSLDKAITRAEGILREELYDCHDILTLCKKLNLKKYMDENLEISGGEQLSVKIRGRQVLMGIIAPKYGGLHLVITRATPSILEPKFDLRLKTIKNKLRKELDYTEKLNRASFEEKLVIDRDRIKNSLQKEVSAMEERARRLGITPKFLKSK